MPTMTHATIATEIHQPLNVHRILTTQVAFYRELGYFGADRIKVSLV
jgi:hypothetical protein